MKVYEKLNLLDGHHWSAERRAESLYKVHLRTERHCPIKWLRDSKVICLQATVEDRRILDIVMQHECAVMLCWQTLPNVDPIHNTCIMTLLNAEYQEE